MKESVKEAQETTKAIVSMLEKSEKAQIKFQFGTSQYTLLDNRIQALRLAYAFVQDELDQVKHTYEYIRIEKAITPLQSLLSKSEKAQAKLKATSWQYKMLQNNISALKLVLSKMLESLTKAGV